MPFVSRRAQLRLSHDEIDMLTALSQSRSEPAGRVQRASMVLRYHAGETVSEIARSVGTSRPRVERCLRKAHFPLRLTAKAWVKTGGICCAINTGAPKWAGSCDNTVVSAWGPPVELPIRTIEGLLAAIAGPESRGISL